MIIPSSTDLAYIAGIMDGEGCISLQRQSKTGSHAICVRITNTDYRLIKFILSKFGGKVQKHRRNKSNWKDYYQWLPDNTQHLKRILILLKPYLILKREQADLMLEYIDTLTTSNMKLSDNVLVERMVIYDELKILNKRGVPLTSA